MARVQLGPRRSSTTSSRKKEEPKSEEKTGGRSDNQSEKGLSLKQLINATPALMRNNAKFTGVKSLRHANTRNGMPAIRAKVWSQTGKTRQVYSCDVIAKEDPDKPIYKQKKVLVSCDCENFMYYWEVADNHWGAAKIKYSNGEHPNATNPGLHPGMCVAKGELVHTLRGLVPIEEVVAGDQVNTLLGYRKVTAAAKTGRRKVVEVTLQSGKRIHVTPTHPIYVGNGNTLEWQPAKDTKGNYAITLSECGSAEDQHLPETEHLTADAHKNVRHIPTTKDRMTSELARVLGYLASEGCYAAFCNDRKDLHEDFVNCANISLSISAQASKGVTNLGPIVRDVLHYLGNAHGSANKVVPDLVFRSSRKCWIEFLRAAYAGDGYITGRVSTYATMNETFARQIQSMLFALGVHTRLSSGESGHAYTTMWYVRTSSVHETQKLIRVLNPIRTNRIKKFKEVGKSYRERLVGIRIKSLMEEKLLECMNATDYGDTSRTLGVKEALNLLGVPSHKHDFCSSLMARQKLVTQVRERKCGKPTSHAVLQDIIDVCFDDVFSAAYRKKYGKVYYCADNYGTTKKADVRALCKNEEFSEFAFLAQENVVMDQVVDIREYATTDVYDLTVEEAEHFVVNGVVVHNCKHLVCLAMEIIKNKL